MTSICFYFQVHQPVRLNRFNIFNNSTEYFDENKNRQIFEKVAGKCYIPTNNILLDLIDQHKNKFKIALSMHPMS